MCDDAGNGPAYRRVSGREGVSAGKKSPCTGTGKRPFAAGCIFENLGVDESANGCLTGENSSLPFLIVMLKVTEQKQATASRRQGSHASVGVGVSVRYRVFACRHVLFDASVSLD